MPSGLTRPLMPSWETKADEARFVRLVRERDGFVCRMERRRGRSWQPCLRHAQDTAHIICRRECGREAFNPLVGIRACRRCHDAYDRHEPGVRVPPQRFAAAFRLVSAHSKVAPRATRSAM